MMLHGRDFPSLAGVVKFWANCSKERSFLFSYRKIVNMAGMRKIRHSA